MQIIKTNPLKTSLDLFLNNASISGAIWRRTEIAALSGITLKRPVLDLGCGDGRFTKLMFSGKLDYGLDISKGAIEKARKNKIYKSYIISDAHIIPLPDKSIQTVFSNSVFEHIPNLLPVLAELSRVLKPSGKIIFTTHSPLSKNFYGVRILKKLNLNRIARIYEKIFCQMLQLKTVWDKETWYKNLNSVGFEAQEIHTIVSPKTAFWYELFMPITFLQNRIPILKKMKMTKLVLFFMRPNFSEPHPEGRNFFIVAQKRNTLR